jgi:hypothetical protein
MEPSRQPPCGRTEAYQHTIAGNPENDGHLSPWQLPASKVGSCVDRQRTHMRTYQKHVGLSMLSFLSCVSLPIPCQALGRETTFPAIVRGITRKMLILQESAPEIEKFSLLFPVSREKSGASERCRRSNNAGLPTAVPRRSSFVPPASTSSSPRSCSGTPPTIGARCMARPYIAAQLGAHQLLRRFPVGAGRPTADQRRPSISARRESRHDPRLSQSVRP